MNLSKQGRLLPEWCLVTEVIGQPNEAVKCLADAASMATLIRPNCS
jgi:hypothetical protein